MYKYKSPIAVALLAAGLAVTGCKVPTVLQATENRAVPGAYDNSSDSSNIARVPWRRFFTDSSLVRLIDTALKNNQELRLTLQEIEMARNDIRIRQGAILPTVGARAGIGVDKVARYTSQGAGDASTEIKEGVEMPEPLTDYTLAAYARWEVDIWKKLRTAKKAAVTRYLATVEGKNFVLTNLVAEVARSYYELRALDNQLEIVVQNIALQKGALEIVKAQKDAARVTELAVQKFAAEVLKSQGLEYDLRQRIRETENRLNGLLARYPQPIPRDRQPFLEVAPPPVQAGLPVQLLSNRPDIRQAELELAATRFDVQVARAEFYPSLELSAALGLQAFRPAYLAKFPESVLYSIAGDLAGPLVNRNAIKAEYFIANARQRQAVVQYERRLLNAYLEVSTQLSKVSNLGRSYELKAREVDALTRSIGISNDLFRSARADYLEVLLTQRDALEAKLELVETKKEQLNAVISVYRDLGGGWQ